MADMKSDAETGTGRPYRMVARAVATEATRDAILAAATAAFWERPSTEVSLEEVADRAGVSARTVLRHFDSKDGLWEAAVQREAARVQAQRDTAPPGDVPAAVRVLVDHYEQMGDRVLRMLAEEAVVPALREVADLGRRTHLAWCRRVFAPALADLDPPTRQRRTAQLAAVCDVYVWKLLRRDAGLDRPQTEQAMVELLRPLVEV